MMSFSPGVAGVGEAFAAELRQVDESEHVQPMGDADHHHVVPARQVGAVVRERSGRSACVAASVQPHHDGPPCRRRAVPGVQTFRCRQSSLIGSVPVSGCHSGTNGASTCGDAGTECEGVAHTGPRRDLERREKAARAGGRRAIRDRLEGLHAVDQQSANASGFRFDD